MTRRFWGFGFLILIATIFSGCSPVLKSEDLGEGQGAGVIYALPTSIVSIKVKLGSVPVLSAVAQKAKQKLETEIRNTAAAIAKAKTEAKPELEKKLKSLKGVLEKLLNDAPTVRSIQIVPGTETVMADPKAQFLLAYKPEFNSDDTVEIQTTESGLLQKVSTRASDKTGEAITLTVKAAADAAVFFASGGLSGLSQGAVGILDRPQVERDPKECREEPDYEVNVLIDPRAQASAYKAIQLAVKAKTGRNCIHLDVYDSGARLIHTSDSNRLSSVNEAAKEELETITSVRKKACESAVCYRRRGSLVFQLRHKDRSVVPTSARLTAPQLGAVGWIDFQRRSFVEAKAEADFNNGHLTRVKYTKPSQLLAIVNVPVDILETIFNNLRSTV